MNIVLPNQLEVWVAHQVQSGKFDTNTQVLQQALELLQMQMALEDSQPVAITPEQRTALTQLVQEGQELKLGY
jgi:putative addiction module CopG family antidote